MQEMDQTSNQPEQRYKVGELLAEGGHGHVYRGVDTHTDAPVIIKRLKPDLQEQPELVARFQRESNALRQLNHPNIVQMLAAFMENGRHTIVMEYVPGGSLQDLLAKNGQLTQQQSLDIALELADALSRAHHVGILHRDLKPGNVLLAADGTPRLTDFGVARLTRDDAQLTTTGTILGSPCLHESRSPARRDVGQSFRHLVFWCLALRDVDWQTAVSCRNNNGRYRPGSQ